MTSTSSSNDAADSTLRDALDAAGIATDTPEAETPPASRHMNFIQEAEQMMLHLRDQVAAERSRISWEADDFDTEECDVAHFELVLKGLEELQDAVRKSQSEVSWLFDLERTRNLRAARLSNGKEA